MIGRSRGGRTTKVHALTDVIGRPYALMPTDCAVRYVTPESFALRPDGGTANAPFATTRIGTRGHLIKTVFYRLKDFHRVAIRYDKLAEKFLSGVADRISAPIKSQS